MSKEVYVYVERNYRADPKDKMCMGRVGVGLRDVCGNEQLKQPGGLKSFYNDLRGEALSLVDVELDRAKAAFEAELKRVETAAQSDAEAFG